MAIKRSFLRGIRRAMWDGAQLFRESPDEYEEDMRGYKYNIFSTLNVFANAAKILAVFYTILFILNHITLFGYDDTDDRANHQRSGLALRVDYGTGCQYLETVSGQLNPRLDSSGRHICAIE